MSGLTRREPRRLSDVFDWLEEGFPAMPKWHPFETRWRRVEDYLERRTASPSGSRS